MMPAAWRLLDPGSQVKEQKIGQRLEMVGFAVAVWPGPNRV